MFQQSQILHALSEAPSQVFLNGVLADGGRKNRTAIAQPVCVAFNFVDARGQVACAPKGPLSERNHPYGALAAKGNMYAHATVLCLLWVPSDPLRSQTHPYMRPWVAAAALVAVAAALQVGCVSTPAGVTIESRAPKDTTQANLPPMVKRAWIFVEGVQQSTTPATVTVRRSFEITNVSLHVGAEFDKVRHYEIERNVTGSRRMLDFSFSGSFQGGYLTFSAGELSIDRKGRHIIPFFEGPIQIIDHEYDLVLLVQQ